MNTLRINPELPVRAAKLPFVQTIELMDGKELAGTAQWSAPTDAGEGVVQLIDLHILPPYRRAKHGTRLLQAALEQARRYQRLRRAPLRRIWTSVRQKTQITARAFLAQNNFHHVATVADLLKDQDLLIYMRSFD